MAFELDRLSSSDAPALLDDASDVWLRYDALVQRVRAAADALRGEPRGLALLFGGNDVQSVVAYLACLEARVPVALLRAGLAPDKRAALIERYRPRCVLGTDPGEGYATAAAASLPCWRATSTSPRVHEDLALLLSTSGSTGSPRMVRLSLRALESNARSIVTGLRIDAAQRTVLQLPLSYSYGLSVLNSHLAAGASVVLTEASLIDRAFWQRAAQQQITSMPGVPQVYQTLKRLGFEAMAPATLKTLTQAGGKLPDALVLHFHELMRARGGKLYVMYGQTEATARISILDPALLPEKLGSVGRAIADGELSIDPESGEIVYRGPNVMLGYAERAEDLARGDELGGRLATGDLGRLDQHGLLYLTGRTKRIAKLNGVRLNLDEVEAMAAEYGAAAAVEREQYLVILLEAGDSPELCERARRGLAECLAVPVASLRVKCVARLPLSDNGKLNRAALEKLA